MQICNIVVLILQIIGGWLNILVFFNLLRFLQKQQSFLHYFSECLKINQSYSNRKLISSEIIHKNDDITIKKSNKVSIKSLIFFVIFKVLSNLFPLFRILLNEKDASILAISRQNAFFLMIFTYCLIFETVVLVFQKEFFYEKGLFLFIFLIIFSLSLLILALNVIFLKINKSFTLSSFYRNLDGSLINYEIFEAFLILCNVLQCVLFVFSLYLLIFGIDLPFSILYYILIAILLETFFFRIIENFLICLLFFLVIKCQKVSLEDYYVAEQLKETKEKEMQSIVLEYINPSHDLFKEGAENIGNLEEGKIALELCSSLRINKVRHEFDNSKYKENFNIKQNLKSFENIGFSENERKQLPHKHNNKKSFVLAKTIKTSPQQKNKRINFFQDEFKNLKTENSNNKENSLKQTTESPFIFSPRLEKPKKASPFLEYDLPKKKLSFNIEINSDKDNDKTSKENIPIQNNFEKTDIAFQENINIFSLKENFEKNQINDLKLISPSFTRTYDEKEKLEENIKKCQIVSSTTFNESEDSDKDIFLQKISKEINE